MSDTTPPPLASTAAVIAQMVDAVNAGELEIPIFDNVALSAIVLGLTQALAQRLGDDFSHDADAWADVFAEVIAQTTPDA